MSNGAKSEIKEERGLGKEGTVIRYKRVFMIEVCVYVQMMVGWLLVLF